MYVRLPNACERIPSDKDMSSRSPAGLPGILDLSQDTLPIMPSVAENLEHLMTKGFTEKPLVEVDQIPIGDSGFAITNKMGAIPDLPSPLGVFELGSETSDSAIKGKEVQTAPSHGCYELDTNPWNNHLWY